MARQKQRFDLVNMINQVTPSHIEYHLNCKDVDGDVRKCSFLGPNTNLPKRLADYDSNNGSFSHVITPAVNKLDALAMIHDIAYTSKDLAVRHRADQELLEGAQQLINDSTTDSHTKRNAKIVKAIMGIKLKLGLGYYGGSLDAQRVNELIREAQQTSKGADFQGGPLAHLAIPLVILAASIGVPAVIALLNKTKKKNK